MATCSPSSSVARRSCSGGDVRTDRARTHRCDPRECAPLTRPPRDDESYDLDRGRLLPALPTDADGQQLITPCQRNLQRWDRRSDMTIRQRSAAICRTECAALAECQKFLPFAQPGSVLAGKVLPVHERPAVSG